MANNYHNTQINTLESNKGGAAPPPATKGEKPSPPIKFEDVNVSSKVKEGLG